LKGKAERGEMRLEEKTPELEVRKTGLEGRAGLVRNKMPGLNGRKMNLDGEKTALEGGKVLERSKKTELEVRKTEPEDENRGAGRGQN
jgi:hypothetical protein